MLTPKPTTVALLASVVVLLSSCARKSQPTTTVDNPQPSGVHQITTSPQDTMIDTILTLKTKYGPIALKLYSDQTPKTVASFLNKANSGFYNNLTFHRVEPGFVVQGGDPLGNGTGGGKIVSEINTLPFKRGSIGLARGPVKSESNDSQFFICLDDQSCSHLTNEYVNFGEVVAGMEFVDQITVGDKIIEISPYTK